MTTRSSSTPTRRGFAAQLLAGASLAAAGLCMTSQALAQAFPSKPITIVVPFSAGGTTDILARIVGQALSA